MSGWLSDKIWKESNYMKYVVLVGDGMGDYPLKELNGLTPLEAATTPNMDKLAQEGRLGLTRTIPDDRQPGSDTANMALMGINPSHYLCGRGPMEAAAMGVDLSERDIAFRCNLVQLGFAANGDIIMDDYAAGHITSAESHELIAALQKSLGSSTIAFHPGVSFRHVLVWKEGPFAASTIPPHDRSGKSVSDVLPADGGPLSLVADVIRSSWPVLANHPINQARRDANKSAANSIWLWGQSKKPAFVTLQERYGLKGVVITAVDLIKGLGKMLGLDIAKVEGATGYLDTNYAGKVQATLDALADGRDFAFVHVEAPDEAAHEGRLDLKIKAINDFDALVVGPLVQGLRKMGPCRILLATDHFTPISIRTHSRDLIPFALWGEGIMPNSALAYNEKQAAASGLVQPAAWDLVDELVKK